jgi:hypothetical protein
MKQNALKLLIKQAVKEAIQEEIKDILLEAIKSPKQTVVENVQPPQIVNQPSINSSEKKDAYRNIMGDMRQQLTSQNVPKPFNPKGGAPGMDLPSGEVNMDQIMGLMNKK